MMDDIRKEQIEALEVMSNYDVRLAKGIRNILIELREEEKEDTKEYLKEIINGLNWTIEAVNGTISLLNETKLRIEKEKFNTSIAKFGEALKSDSNTAIADALEQEMLPLIEELLVSMTEVLDEQK